MSMSLIGVAMPRRNDTSVKIDIEVVKQARIVATHRNTTVAEYLTELLRAAVARDYRAAIQEMAQDVSEPPGAPAPSGRRPKGGA